MAGYWSCLLSEAAAGSTLRDAGTGKDAGTSLAAGDGSLTERMQLFFVVPPNQQDLLLRVAFGE